MSIPFEGVTITFLTRLIDKSTTHKYIEITDTPSPNVPDRIKERVYLPNGVNSETLPSDKSQEETELSCFIDKIISKYIKLTRASALPFFMPSLCPRFQTKSL